MRKLIVIILTFAVLSASFISVVPYLTFQTVRAADVIGDNLVDSRVQDFTFAGSSLVINNVSVSANSPFVAVYVVWRENGESINDVSVGPVTLNFPDASITQLSPFPPINTHAYYFYSPTDGVHDVTVNFSGNTDEVVVSVVSFANVLNANTIYNSNNVDGQDFFSTSEFVSSNQALVGVLGIDGLPPLTPDGNTQIIGEAGTITTKAALFGSAQDGFGDLEITYDGFYHYNYIYELIEFDQISPYITVTNEPVGDIEDTNFISFDGNVEDFNGFNIADITYSLDGGGSVNVDALDGFFDSSFEEFYIDLGYLANGSYSIEINATNDNAESAPPKIINFTVNNLSTLPDCELSNHSSPTTDTTPSYVAVCSSLDGLYNAEYRVYDFNTGILQDWTGLSPDSGSFGDTDLTFSFTIPFPLPDSNIEIKFRIDTGTGQTYTDGEEPVDVIVVETTDDSVPLVIANPVLPNPTVDDTPTIVGYCHDNQPFDTNSFISLILYQLDGGGWTGILPSDGIYDEFKENFEIPLGPLPTGGPYTVEVRCVDAAGNDTDAGAANDTVTFTIVPPVAVPAEEVIVTEEFDDDLANALSESSVVWGSGYIRLRETLTHNQTAIDTDNFGSRYGFIFGSEYNAVKGDNGLLYYAKGTTVHSYNPTTTAIIDYDLTVAAPFIGQISEFVAFSSGADDYLVMTTSSGLLIFNTDTSSGYLYNANGLDVGLYGPDQVKVDRRNGRTGLIVRNNNPNGGNTSNVFYLDLGADIMDTNDDSYVWFENDGGINLNNVSEVMLDEQTNGIYMTAFGDGLVRLDDNNTPTDTSDDDRFIHVTGVGVDLGLVTHIEKDTQTGAIYLIQTDTESRLLAYNTSGTPTLSGDDSFVILANSSELRRQSITEMAFVEGPTYIGGQLFLGTAQGQVLYFNTNGSPYQTSDDTVIELDVSLGVYPVSVNGLIVDDYNNVYVNLDRLGFYQLELNRGWDTSNTAVTVPFVPEDRIIVNNITLVSSTLGPQVQTSGSTIPNGSGNGILYYVSVDDGMNWTPITVGETVFVPEEDYRFRFRIDLSQLIGEHTPIVDDFTLRYGTYQDDDQIEQPDLDLDANPLIVEPNEDFILTVTAIDPLGYPIPSYNGVVDLELRDDGTLNPVPYFNYTQVNLVNGVATLNDAAINTLGLYFVQGTAPGPIESNSPTITVTAAVGTLDFTATDFNIIEGESTTLQWTSTNLVSLELDGTPVAFNDSLIVSPSVTTTYTLIGEDGNGTDFIETVTITVTPQTGGGDDGGGGVDGGGFDPGGDDGGVDDGGVDDGGGVDGGGDVGSDDGGTGSADGGADGGSDQGTLGGGVGIGGTGESTTDGSERPTNPGEEIIRGIKISEVGRFARNSLQEITDVDVSAPTQPNEEGNVQSSDTAIELLIPLAVAAGIVGSTALLYRTFGYVAIFLGGLVWRRRKYWGFIMDAGNKNPLGLVTIRVYKFENGQQLFVTQTISDLDGAYGINIAEKGTYMVEFKRENYKILTRQVKVNPEQDVVFDVLLQKVDQLNLPLIAQIRTFLYNHPHAVLNVLRAIVVVVTIFGLQNAWLITQINPSTQNMMITGLHMLVLIASAFLWVLPTFNVKAGKIIDEQKNPIKGASVRLYHTENFEKLASLGLSNEAGIVKAKIKPGMYKIVATAWKFEEEQLVSKVDKGGKLMKTITLKKSLEENQGGFLS